MLAGKDPSAILRPLDGRIATLSVIPVPGHDSHDANAFAPHCRVPPRSFATVEQALHALPADGLPVLIAGSLYLAGEVLRSNGEAPD
jgi:dihydrofolate synthase/folylpolyglutamate synthase